MSDNDNDTTGESTATDGGNGRHEVYTPTIRPALVILGFTLTLAVAALAYLSSNPEVAGDENLTQIVQWVVVFIAGLITIRLMVKIFVLQRMQYVITDSELRREYALLMRRKSREIPLGRLRGLELNQGRIQTLLGYGTVNFLTGGTNQSLGFVEFEHVDDPDSIRDTVRELIVKHDDQAQS